MKYLLDTNTISGIMRDPRGPAAARLRRRDIGQICTSIVVAAQLRFGAERKGSRILTERVDAILEQLPVLPLEATVDRLYAGLRARLERKGRPIGANDLLIAAHALALRCTLVTDNVREFSRIDSLAVENWLRE
jgi:tRNA(fMet)-specific endonuclease VapC